MLLTNLDLLQWYLAQIEQIESFVLFRWIKETILITIYKHCETSFQIHKSI